MMLMPRLHTWHYDGRTTATWTSGAATLFNLLHLGSGTGRNHGCKYIHSCKGLPSIVLLVLCYKFVLLSGCSVLPRRHSGHYDGSSTDTWTSGDATLYNLLLGSGTGITRGTAGLSTTIASGNFDGANGLTLDDGMWCVLVRFTCKCRVLGFGFRVWG